MILQYDNFDDETLLIFLINGLITYIFLIEIFSVRWNQLSLKEKNQLATLKEISGKFQIFFNVIRITFQRIFTKSLIVDTVKKTSTAKKWVRKANKDELSPLTDDGFISSQSTNNPKKDIID